MRTVARKFSIRGLCHSVGGFGFVRGGLTFQKLTKTQLIHGVSCFNLGGLGALFGGLSPQNPPRGDGTGRHTIKQLPRESSDPSACPWLLRIQIWCLGKFLSFYGLTKFMLKWIWYGSEAGGCHDFFVGYLNKCWIRLQNFNCSTTLSCVTTLSISVIVNFSVTATCVWPRKLSISMNMTVAIQVTQLLTWNFARSVTDLRYFLD